jgi:uncharacterized protein (DUF433 family)
LWHLSCQKSEAWYHVQICDGMCLSIALRDSMCEPLQIVVCRDPDILGGAPVFVDTRVPVQTLLDYIQAGDSLDEFLDDFPSVSRVLATTLLQQIDRSHGK